MLGEKEGRNREGHEKGVHRANVANDRQLLQVGLPSSVPCMPNCSVTA